MASAGAIDYLFRRHAVHANRILAWPTIGRGARNGDRRARGRILGRGGRLAQNHPYRHGCVLRIGRTARQSGAARQAGRGRRIARTRRRRGGKLRSAQVRRAFRDAVDHRQAEMPRSDLRQAALRRLQGDLPADPGDLRRIHADHRAIVARRGVSRRHRKPQGHRLGDTDRGRNPRKDSRRNRAHGFGRRLLQQVPRQTRLRSPQAGRALRHHAENGAGIRRDPAGQEVSRRRAGDGQEDGAARDRDRARSQGRRPWPSCSSISGKRAPIITGLRAASTSGPSAPIGYANPSAPRTRFPPISSPTKPRAMRFEKSSTRCGSTARAPAFAAAQSHSRSSSPTSSRSRAAAPVRCRSGRGANSNSSATHCSNLSFLSRKVFGSWASPCLHSRRKRLNASPNSACPFRLCFVASRDRSWAATMSYTELGGLVLGTGLVAAFICALLHRIVHHDRFRRYHEVGYPGREPSLDQAYTGRLWTLPAVDYVDGDSLALHQARDPRALQRRSVHKDILAAPI